MIHITCMMIGVHCPLPAKNKGRSCTTEYNCLLLYYVALSLTMVWHKQITFFLLLAALIKVFSHECKQLFDNNRQFVFVLWAIDIFTIKLWHNRWIRNFTHVMYYICFIVSLFTLQLTSKQAIQSIMIRPKCVDHSQSRMPKRQDNVT